MKPQHKPRSTGPLSALRVSVGLSQEEAASRAGITKTALLNLEAGRCLPRRATCVAIARAWEVPIEKVFRAVAEEQIRALPRSRHGKPRKAASAA